MADRFFEPDDMEPDTDQEQQVEKVINPVANRLLKARTIIISGDINQKLAARDRFGGRRCR